MITLRASGVLVGLFSLGLAVLTPPVAADTFGWLSEEAAAVGVQPMLAASSQGRIAFWRGGDVYTMNANGAKVRRLTQTKAVTPGSPSWSPEGRLIVFTQESLGIRGVWVAAVDSGRALRLTDPDRDASTPAWSPDGRRIAYLSDVEAYGNVRKQLHVIDADGANQHRLSTVDSLIISPAWSPDGRWIALSTRRKDRYVLRSDGTEVQRLPERGRMPGLVWSPDGHLLAWTTVRGLRTRDLRSGTERLLTPGTARSLAWSPDGRWIAFEGEGDVVSVVRADGSKLRRLHRGYLPNWSPDGRRLVFNDNRWNGLKVMDADGRHVHTLAAGCCADWFGAAPTRTTLDAFPEPVAKGARLRLTGTVTKVRVPLPAATVRISFKASGKRRFTAETQATTNANGRFRVTVTGRRSGVWKAVHPATPATLSSGATDNVTVRRR